MQVETFPEIEAVMSPKMAPVNAPQPAMAAEARAAKTAAELAEFAPLAALREAGIGVALAALFGLALGTRTGGSALVESAMVIPASYVAVSLLGVPALGIALVFFDRGPSAVQLAALAARAIGRSGRVLGGLAPIVAMYATTAETELLLLLTFGSLAVAGLVALLPFLATLRTPIFDETRGNEPNSGALQVHLALGVFAVFATILAVRIWTTLPILGGAS